MPPFPLRSPRQEEVRDDLRGSTTSSYRHNVPKYHRDADVLRLVLPACLRPGLSLGFAYVAGRQYVCRKLSSIAIYLNRSFGRVILRALEPDCFMVAVCQVRSRRVLCASLTPFFIERHALFSQSYSLGCLE